MDLRIAFHRRTKTRSSAADPLPLGIVPRAEGPARTGPQACGGEPANPLVAGLPKEVRIAHALQTVQRLVTLSGNDATAHVAEAANRGVSGHGGASQSESIDLRRANTPWARLCVQAQSTLRNLRSIGGRLL